MYEEAIRLMTEEGDYSGCLEETRRLIKEGACDDQIYVLEASALEALGRRSEELESISNGLRANYRNYELFYMLGLFYLDENINKSYMCFAQSLWYLELLYEDSKNDSNSGKRAECNKTIEEMDADREQIHQMIGQLEMRPDMDVRKTSFAILSYDDNGYMQENLEAIRKYCIPDSYEIIVVDNASTDGVTDYLRLQEDIALIENDENVGFSIGCNQAVRACSPMNDIFLLNNDAILTPNALFWLKMALYEDRNVGAVGPVSNNATVQSVEDHLNADRKGNLLTQMAGAERIGSYDDWFEYAIHLNVPSDNPYENRPRLTGFAVLIKREVIPKVLIEGDLLDTVFSPAYFEDDDLGIRIAQAGYRQILVHNAFVYHYGGAGFDESNKVMENSRNSFIAKWGFDMWGYEAPDEDVIANITDDKKAPIRVLEVGCGMGVTLSRIKYLYPNSYVTGVSFRTDVASCGKYLADIRCEQLLTFNEIYPEHSFDYIIVSEAMKSAPDEAKAEVGDKIRGLLRDGGRFL